MYTVQYTVQYVLYSCILVKKITMEMVQWTIDFHFRHHSHYFFTRILLYLFIVLLLFGFLTEPTNESTGLGIRSSVFRANHLFFAQK